MLYTNARPRVFSTELASLRSIVADCPRYLGGDALLLLATATPTLEGCILHHCCMHGKGGYGQPAEDTAAEACRGDWGIGIW